MNRITHRELGLTATTLIVAGSETSEFRQGIKNRPH
jgi:hypothetical protein